MPMPNLYVSTTHGRHKTKEIFLAVNELRLHKLHTHSSHQNVVFFYSHIQTKKKLRIITRGYNIEHMVYNLYIVNACWYQKYFIFLKLGHIYSKLLFVSSSVVVVDNACVLLIRDHISHH